MSVRLSACISAATTERISAKFGIGKLYVCLSRKSKFDQNQAQNLGHFTLLFLFLFQVDVLKTFPYQNSVYIRFLSHSVTNLAPPSSPVRHSQCTCIVVHSCSFCSLQSRLRVPGDVQPGGFPRPYAGDGAWCGGREPAGSQTAVRRVCGERGGQTGGRDGAAADAYGYWRRGETRLGVAWVSGDSGSNIALVNEE